MVSPDWESLPDDLLDAILEKLVRFSDFVRFSIVCKQWLSLAARQKHRRRMEDCHKQVPLLLIPAKGRSKKKRGLYSITQKKFYKLQLPIHYDMRCCGSSYGWLAAVEKNLGITLINPFSGKTISLPPLYSAGPGDGKYEYYVTKVILSTDPSMMPNDFVAAAMWDNRVAFIKSGNKSWTHIKRKASYVPCDVNFCKGALYTAEFYQGIAHILSIDISGKFGIDPQLKVVASVPLYCSSQFIVESSRGDLLLVLRFLQWNDHLFHKLTYEFKVLKLIHEEEEEGGSRWIEMESLENDALFLGENHSQSVVAPNFPGCRPNCIYFTDADAPYDPPLGPRVMGYL